MQAVAEFVEQGAGVVGREQRGLATRALGEIADVDDQRRDRAVELLLVAQRGHPGARALRGPGKVVAIEQRLVGAAPVADLPDPDVGMPDRDILALGEGDPEQARGAVEGGLDHVVQRQIGLDRAVVEIGFALAQLLGVVAPVPGREREIAALLRDQRLQLVTVGERPRPGRLPDPLKQTPDGLRRLRHGVLEPIGGEGRKPQQLRALLAQRQDLGDDLLVVVGVAIVAAGDEGLVDLLPQVAASQSSSGTAPRRIARASRSSCRTSRALRPRPSPPPRSCRIARRSRPPRAPAPSPARRRANDG